MDLYEIVMNMHRTFILIALAAVMFIAGAAVALDRKSDLQERFKKRFRDIAELKQDGAIGETWEGYLQAVKGKKLAGRDKDVVEDENADRKQLYKIIAEEEGATLEKVAERNAQRHLRGLKRGHWFLLKSGEWRQKE